MNFPDNHPCNALASDVGDYDRFSPAAAIVCAETILERGCALRINVKGADHLKSVRFGPDDAQTIEQECDLDQFQLVMMHACVAFSSKVRIVYEMKDGRVIPSAASQ